MNDNNLQKTITIDNFINDASSEYGDAIVTNTFSNLVDGLKRVQFRFILIAHKYKLIDTAFKSARILGAVKDYHPHGEIPIYEAIINLSQEWVTNPPLGKVIGNKGTYQGAGAAAYRYTELSISEYAYDVYIKGIDLDTLPDVLGDSYLHEPTNFIPALPQTLLMCVFAIGYGYQSKTVSLYLDNVCDLISAYAKALMEKKEFNPDNHISWFLPNFPTLGYLLNTKTLIKEYKNGKFESPIIIDGKVTLYKDKLHIHSVPHGIDFGNTINAIKTELYNNKNGFLDKSIDDILNGSFENSRDGNIIIKLKRNVNVFLVYYYLVKKYKLTNSFIPNPHYSSFDTKIYKLNYMQLLETWFRYRENLIYSMRINELRRLNSKKLIADAICILLTNKEKFLKIVKEHADLETVVPILMKTFKITRYQAYKTMAMPLSSLLSKNIAKLKEELKSYQSDMDRLYSSLKTIKMEIAQTALSLKKKYHAPRNTVIPSYVGYVKFENGSIQFESSDEIKEIISRFPKCPFKIHYYNFSNYRILINEDNQPYPDKEQLDRKYFIGDILDFKDNPYTSKKLKTVKLENNRIKNICPVSLQLRSDSVIHAGSEIIILYKSGELKRLLTTDKSLLSPTVNKSIAAILLPSFKETYLCIQSDKCLNKIYLFKIGNKDTKISVPKGKLHYQFYFTGKEIYFNLNQSCLHRLSCHVIHFKDMNRLFKGNENSHVLELNDLKKTKSQNIHLY